MDNIKKQIADFQNKWPLEKIRSLTLEEYTNDRKDSFTYDLEFGTKEVINISGGSSYRNGIYKRNSISSFNGEGNRLTDDNYAWFAKYGKTADEAFRSVQSLIIQLIEIAKKGDDLQLVDGIDLGHATKWKLIYMYNPDLILPIVSHEKLARIAQLKFNINVDGKTFWEIQQAVIQQKPTEVDGYEFAKSLWAFESSIDLQVILENFFTQLDSGDLKSSHYPKEYSGLKLKVNFGKGNIAKVPSIAFLKEGKTVKSGIFPVLLYFTTQELLFVSCGIGEEKLSNENWDFELESISDWFHEKNLGIPDRYGNYLIYQVYKRQELDFQLITGDVNALIDFYNEIVESNKRTPNREIVSNRSYWLLKTGTDGELWPNFLQESIAGIGYKTWTDLSKFESKVSLNEAIPMYSPDWSGNNKNHLVNLWGFSHEIAIGDIIIAAKGTRKYLGYGVVKSPYYYKPDSEIRHRIDVNWHQTGEWSINESEHGFNIKTLLRMDQYMPWPKNVIEMMDNDQENHNSQYTRSNALSELFIDEVKLDQILSILERKKNIVLQGPPGTGKTFIAKRLAFCAMGRKDNSKVEMVQFHQSFSYEDFIQGYRPTQTGNFSLINGVFYRFCKKAINDPNNKYFFIIDEINRGNLSKIFGELMLLIEGDKRGEHYAVTLTYQSDNEQFYVPRNVYVIGTMNTADRSLAVVDYALRRRFSFISIHPNFNDQFKNYMSKYMDMSFINKISDRLTILNEEINSDLHLGEGFLIGHSYFCATENINSPELWFKEIVQFELEPLLNEYWFDEPEKVRSSIERLLQ